MKQCILCLPIVILFLVKTISGDISDDECGILVPTTTEALSNATTIAPSISTTIAPSISPESSFSTRKIAQKSLLIVFDGTGSMHDDLAAMVPAAKEIIKSFSSRKENPIKNYVLVVFQDPRVTLEISTETPEKIFAALDAITLGDPSYPNNNDLPEYSLTGLKHALDYAEPNSITYLFTDAGAKDYNLFSTILPIIQKKQVTVNFLTSDISPSYNPLPSIEVYDKIARASEGQVFKMSNEIIKKVLLSITQALEPKYEQLLSLNAKAAVTTKTTVKVDVSFTEVSVTLSGKNSKLSVKNSKNESITSLKSFSSDNIKFETFEVSDSEYNVEAFADSDYTIRIGGISDLKISFGFSTNIPRDQGETSFRPLIGSQNHLSVFVSDTSLVKCLTDATFFASNDGDSFPETKFPFETKTGNMYTTALIDIPTKMFKIVIKGYDKNGNVINRIISSGLESVTGEPPEVAVSASSLMVKQYDELTLSCKVVSLIPLTTTWMFGSTTLQEKFSKQSSETRMTIRRFDSEHVGKYVCTANNSVGQSFKEVLIGMKLKPILTIDPQQLTLKEGEQASVKCAVEKAEASSILKWKVGSEYVEAKVNNVYEFTAGPHNHNSKITCELISGDFNITQTCSVAVEFAPNVKLRGTNLSGAQLLTFLKPLENVTITTNQTKLIECVANGNPTPKVSWIFQNETIQESSTLELSVLSDSGLYTCAAENSRGSMKTSFNLNVMSGPALPKDFDKSKFQKGAAIGSGVELVCPFTKYNFIIWESNKKILNGEMGKVLKLKNVDAKMVGEYRCIAVNSEGSDSFTFALGILEKPTLESLNTATNKVNLVTLHSENISVLKGQELELSCKAHGFPTPETTWTTPDNATYFDEKLKIEKVEVIDSGLYVCKAENDQGEASIVYEVSVASPPRIEDGMHEVAVEGILGKSLTLTCKIDGTPAPDFQWFHESKPLTGEVEKTLVIEKLSRQTIGDYKCVGSTLIEAAIIDFHVALK